MLQCIEQEKAEFAKKLRKESGGSVPVLIVHNSDSDEDMPELSSDSTSRLSRADALQRKGSNSQLVIQWTPQRVVQWLKAQSPEFDKYAITFKTNEISGGIFLFLSDKDLKEMGMEDEHRSTFLKKRQTLLESSDIALLQ
eukprot:TRINITY_DN19451_c0_g1_i1.p1 TRINITY_DN19451_c0_g1~~TRINITY_DN19451_c0_g1_i1.p1  ORF type:complete len:140 (+),score=29.19 TRINITY_DN19451_c0_g1_i1:205-624(+)